MNVELSNYEINAAPDFDNSKQIQMAIDTCSETGGGKVVLPAGTKLMSGPFDLKSNVHLVLEPNSEILANPEESVYSRSAFRENRGEGMIWIGGEGLEDVSISGSGSLNGNDTAFMGKELDTSFDLKPIDDFDPRPHILTLVGCKNVTLRDATFKNSAYWCIHLAGCDDVIVDGLRVKNSLKVRNSDGIDLDHCKRVNISNCHITSGDDCICLKNRREYVEYGNCENITITNCTMTSTSCSLKIGSENVNAIRNVVVSNCIITDSNRGVGIQNRDEGTVQNVLFENLIIESRLFADEWWGKAEPIYITAYRRASGSHKDQNWRFAPGQKEGKVGHVEGIVFNNCKLTGENGVYVSGESGKISNIQLKNLDILIKKTSKYEGGFYDRRPCVVKGLVKSNIAAVYVENAEDVLLADSKVRWGKNLPPYYVKALNRVNVKDFVVKNFKAEDPPK